MTRRLFWCAGRFTYPRGSNAPLHFLPFKEYDLDDGVEFARIFAIRALRKGQEDSAFPNSMHEDAMEGSSDGLVARMAVDILRSQTKQGVNSVAVTEFYSGAGLLFEYLKYLLESPQNTLHEAQSIMLRYHVWGHESFALKFQVLHEWDSHESYYMSDGDPHSGRFQESVTESNLVIYNHAESIHHRQDPSIDLVSVLKATSAPIIISMRAVHGDLEQQHTTVKGRTVVVPCSEQIIELCRSGDPFWSFKYVEEYDTGFFLPQGDAEPGLLLGYTARRPYDVPGFEPAASLLDHILA